MGISFSKICHNILRKRSLKLIMVGFENSGKTSLLHSLDKEKVFSAPVGFHIEMLNYEEFYFIVWDTDYNVYRRDFIFRNYCQNTDGIIFVIDSTNCEKIKEVNTKLKEKLAHQELKNNCPILILANKQDLENAMTIDEIKIKLNMKQFNWNQWKIFGNSANNDKGFREGLEWIGCVIKKRK